MLRSLGRAYPQRMLVRLSLLLKEPLYSSLFEEVLCHEVAHLVVFQLHGRAATCHGPEWQRLLQLAGFEPRRSYITDAPPAKRDRAFVCYDHVCRICQTKRTARRPMRNWRCIACQNAGLDGKLIIQSRPVNRKVSNAE
ncbi:MAG: SprT-like domain-containing protein [Planctomycetaceae bacterium]|nr:SprT-like domain-containing protein [Planctomycetaceae bacterium]